MKRTCKLLTVGEVAAMFSVAVSSVWRWTKQGVLPAPVKIGGRTRWLETEVLDAIKRARAEREGSERKKPARASAKGKGGRGGTNKSKRKRRHRVRLNDDKPKRT